MASRRRIDWQVILDRDAPQPAWSGAASSSSLVSLLLAFDDLFLLEDVDAMLRRAVEHAIHTVGLVRAGLYLYDAPLDLMLGTWGTSLERKVIDEHHVMFELGEEGRRVFERAVNGESPYTLVEKCPLIVLEPTETRVVAQAWVACTPIRTSRAPLGMLYNDPGMTETPVDPEAQARAAVLCTLVGSLLDSARHFERATRVPSVSGRHPVVANMVRMLTQNPSLGGKDMASKCHVSLSRLARLFKEEMGMSLVDYRNRLRLARFLVLVDSGTSNLLEAALAAGFGSYAQFHRVFRSAYGTTPQRYLASRP